jgi:hypothetical protein
MSSNVPHKCTPEALQDIVGGRVPVGFIDITAADQRSPSRLSCMSSRCA